ncbi:hypothetical protein K9M48_04560 [Candidatus Gracilibacteria bacterium]|nr:hypothetical protein [Candidatus Gracilibacteria bacterium]
MKDVNYQKLADVLEECIQYAKDLKVNMENPDGKRETFKISDISITLLNYQNRAILFKNGIKGESISMDQNAEISIHIWISNKNKMVKSGFSYTGIIPDPEYLQIFFRGIINSNIKSAINKFFLTKVKDNKYSLSSDDEIVVDLPEIPIVEEFCENGLNKIENLMKWLYIKPNIIGLNGSLSINRKVWIVCNSKGTKVIQYQDVCSVSFSFNYLSDKKILIEDVFVDYYKTFKELLTSLNDIKNKLSKKLAKMETKRIDSGIYPILLKPSAVCTLFHEAIAGHMLSAKYILNGNSTVFENKLGKRFANNGDMPALTHISIHDKPLDTSMVASYRYDMEGTLAKDVCLLEKGIVRNYLTDKNCAARLKQKSNGHYLAECFTERVSSGDLVAIVPEPRVSNLFVESHTDITLKEMEEAIFAEFDWYLEIDSRSGEVFIDTGTFDLFIDSVTRVYKNGRREAISAGILSSNLTDFLASIQIVSNHYGESKGFCGSSSGYVTTHEKAPAMTLYGINFVTDPKPEKYLEIDPIRDKFIPQSFLNEVLDGQLIRGSFSSSFFYPGILRDRQILLMYDFV